MWLFAITFVIGLNCFAQDKLTAESKHKNLFKFIEVPKIRGMPLQSTDIEKLRISLSLEILESLNSGSAQEAQCILGRVVDGQINSQHLEIASEMLSRYEYHETGYLPCKATKKKTSMQELNTISENLWKNRLFRNENPSGYCRGRAFLISKILDDSGIKSKMITMKGNILATYKKKSGFQVAPYLEHYANIVEVEENGKIVEFVIDPMFTEKPITLEEYIELVKFPSMPISYEIKHQTYTDKLTPPLKDETCQYNVKLLKDYEDAIKASIDGPSDNIGSEKTYKTATQAKKDYIKETLEFNSNQMQK